MGRRGKMKEEGEEGERREEREKYGSRGKMKDERRERESKNDSWGRLRTRGERGEEPSRWKKAASGR